MVNDNLKLINNKIKNFLISGDALEKYNFSNHLKLHHLFLKHQKPNLTIEIYDITFNEKHKDQQIFSINDHINRIGENPFIGQQKFFNIDFINVEKIYLQTKTGTTTTSCGNRYEKEKKLHHFPSTYMANISALAHIHQYKVKGFLVNQL
jgi:hypothetical protein